MATKCFIPLLGKMIRVTELDNCLRIPTGAQQIATDGFTTLSLTSEVEEGAEIIVRKASGALCVNERLASSFKRFTVEMEFCEVNPSLLAITTNAEEYLDGTDVIGFTIPEGEIKKWFALEMWTGLSGIVCDPDVEEPSGYILIPGIVAGVLGDVEVNGEDAITFSMTEASTKGGNAWGVGPYNVYKPTAGVAGPLPTAVDPYDHLLMIETNIAPPPAACDPAPVPTTP